MAEGFAKVRQRTPPAEMYKQVKHFFADLPLKHGGCNAMEQAAWVHAEYVRIHPFVDGNGRSSRLLMKYQLMEEKFLPISIPTAQRRSYYNALEAYAVKGELAPFAELVWAQEEKS